MKLPFWLDPQPPRRPSLSGKHQFDVVVVGGGLSGVSTAWHLVQEGFSVALVEARGIGFSATGRNAGFILQGTAERYNRAIVQMGREKAREVHAYSLENHRLMREVIENFNIDCEYQCRGSLQLASSKEEVQELLESAELLVEDGFKAVLQEGPDLGEPYISAGFHTGIHLPEDGELHPALFVQNIAKLAEAKGLIIFENSPILRLESDETVTVHSEQGSIEAEVAILCTNAHLGEVLPSYKDFISPVRGQMLTTNPMSQLFNQPIYADHGFDYWRQTPEGRIVLGGWRNLDPEAEVGYDEILNDGIQEQMTRFLKRFRGLENVEITHRWSGIMGFSQDGLPLVGPLPGSQNILLGAGFTGHGFGFAWLAGQSLSQLLSEGTSSFADLVSPSRFI